MEDRSTVTLDARTGYYDSKQQLLDLRKDIFLQSSTGYEAKLSQALLDINKGTVTSEEPVDVKLLNGTLAADRLRIINSGEVVRFEGNVVMNLVMDQPDAAASQPETPEPPARQRRGRLRPSPPARNDLDDRFFLSAARAPGGTSRDACAGALALGLLAAGEARAQSTMQGVPNAMQGFSQNRDQPIQIEAASLEVRDKTKEAIFSGNVKVVQGDTTMTSKTLVVFYDQSAAPAPPPPPSRRRAKAHRARRSSRPSPDRAAVPRSSGWKRAAMWW